ncbi:ComEC/Rec2 family competence protein [Corynebacterium sp. HS2168-gen11]|uniref:ComEC/Rec2 family competence protein n=1 Tax=Corynebacterium sp. HS2168-gen11 TaxID=2974027 RepID=UPI00216B5C7D|nr:ComEC/Rec2 family competence protein [Corynebacterium sp. HS2168-gen11]MCS4535347.1 ComEC/Rec2 family competence protein [Corynebacterium sp. HS2168-gen11]
MNQQSVAEYRLVPPAVAIWAITVAVVWLRLQQYTWLAISIVGVLSIAVVAVILYLQFGLGQACLTAGTAITGLVLTAFRRFQAEHVHIPTVFEAVVEHRIRSISRGTIFDIHTSFSPAPLTVFSHDHLSLSPGTTILLEATTRESDRMAVAAQLLIAKNVTVRADPDAAASLTTALKSSFVALAQQTFDPDAAAVIPAMVLGETHGYSQYLAESFMISGLAHLSAVSGANVALVAASTLGILRWAPRKVRLGVTTLAIVCFGYVVGPEASVIRAVIMGSIGIAALGVHTRSYAMHSLCLSMIGMLIWDSELAFSIGFWLSVTATTGIILLSPRLYHRWASPSMPRMVVLPLAVTVAATLATAPIVAAFSHRVSLVSIVANMLVEPLVAPITCIGLLACVLLAGSLLTGWSVFVDLAAGLLYLLGPCARVIVKVATTAASFPGAQLYWDSPALVWAVILGLAWLLYGFSQQLHGVVGVAGISVMIALSASWYLQRPIHYTPEEILHVRDDAHLQQWIAAGIPTHIHAVVVHEHGKPHQYPQWLDTGIPLLYPNRDGIVDVYTNGQQYARLGYFQ